MTKRAVSTSKNSHSTQSQITHLVIPFDGVLYPSVRIPLTISHPSFVRAVNEAFATSKDIFLIRTSHLVSEGSGLDSLLDAITKLPKIGILCRIERTRNRDNGELELLINGRERAVASEYVIKGEVVEAPVFPDVLPELVSDEEEQLVQDIFRLFKELRWRLPRPEGGDELLIDTVRRESAGSDPSDFADFVAFVLSVTNRISPFDQQRLLTTFSAKRRLHLLKEVLLPEVENEQLGRLLRKRVRRFAANEFPHIKRLAALFYIAERKHVSLKNLPTIMSGLLGRPIKSKEDAKAACEEPQVRQQIDDVLADARARKEIDTQAHMTLTRRQNYVFQHLFAALDVAIASLYLQARVQIKQEIKQAVGEEYDREERLKNRDSDLRLYREWVSENLGIVEGRPEGSKNKPKPLDEIEAARKAHEKEILTAMCEILRTTRDDDALKKQAVIKQLGRSRSTVYGWFRKGLDFERLKEIARFMYNDSAAFTEWSESGKGFKKMMDKAKGEYEKNVG